MLYKNTITDNMYNIAGIINTNFTEYYLAGGTALSLQIGHRNSVDLDYFTKVNFDTQTLLKKIKSIFENEEVAVTYEEENTLWLIIDGVKLSFIKRESDLIEDFISEEVFKMASVKDILIMKLGAICNRSEYKDYYDIALISKVIDCRIWTNLWLEVNKGVDPISFIVSLSYYDNVEYMHLSGENIIKRETIKSEIEKIVSEINSFLNL